MSFLQLNLGSNNIVQEVCAHCQHGAPHAEFFMFPFDKDQWSGSSDQVSCQMPTLQTPQTQNQHVKYLSQLFLSHSTSSIRISLPLNLASHTLNLIQRTSHLNNTIPQHPRIKTQSPPNRMLRSRRAVKAHSEVMACIVRGVVFSHWLGQVEDAPVGYAADDAAGVEDY